MHYIIDGYNLLFRQSSARVSDNLNLERQKVIQELSLKLKVAGLQASLVFDAHLKKEGLSQKSSLDNFLVYYTEEGQTADDFIIELVRHAANPLEQTVVTSDSLLAWRARRRGAKSLSVEEFQSTLERIYKKKLTAKPPQNPPPKPPTKKPSLEERYAKIFEEKDQQEPKFKKSVPTQENSKESDYERWLKAFEKDSNGA